MTQRQPARHRATRLLLSTVAVSLLSGCGGSLADFDPFSADSPPQGQVTVTPGPAPVQAYAPPPPASRVESQPLAPVATARPIQPQPAAPRVSASSAGGTHRVVKGDTVYSLARRYGTTPAAIQQANGLGPDFAIKLDQVLTIPGGSGPVAMAPRPTTVAAAPASSPAPVRAAANPAAAPKRLMQPVQGSIVSEFGSSTGTATNDGIDFAANPGAPVSAAADGTVAFVSDDTGPLGSVVLIQHGGGMVTIYGRIAQATVKPGQTVSAGMPIARVAAPRSGGKALMHFELRRGSKPVDPTGLLNS